jgi:UDP-N-acetylglucosamine:LPS N-acetylglucosamine transferase
MIERLRPWYERKGIEVVSSFSEVLKRADLYACDNSSSLFEFAATGRPVMVLNPPFYRKTVHHGLRFWDAATVGISCDQPSEFNRTVTKALTDQWRVEREAALDKVYSPRTGGAELAAGYLVDWLKTR